MTIYNTRRRFGGIFLIVTGLIGCSDDVGMRPPTTFPDGNVIEVDAGLWPDARVDAGSMDATSTDAGTGMDASLPDAQDPCLNVTITTTVTASSARTRIDELDGQLVLLTGTATTGPVSCTDLACPPEDPCCNECQANVSVDGIAIVSSECISSVGCTGTECRLVCVPPVLPFESVFRGRLVKTASDTPQLELY